MVQDRFNCGPLIIGRLVVCGVIALAHNHRGLGDVDSNVGVEPIQGPLPPSMPARRLSASRPPGCSSRYADRSSRLSITRRAQMRQARCRRFADEERGEKCERRKTDPERGACARREWIVEPVVMVARLSAILRLRTPLVIHAGGEQTSCFSCKRPQNHGLALAYRDTAMGWAIV